MVSPSVGLPKTRVELADLVRRFVSQYTRPARSPDDALAKEGGLRTSPPAARQSWEDDLTVATTATRCSGTTTAAATGLVPNATPAKPKSGSVSVKPNCCPAAFFMPS